MAGITARFGHTPVQFEGALYGRIARSIAFTAPMQLGEADLVAALWLATSEGGLTTDDLADADLVRQLVAEVIVNDGLDQVGEARATVADLAPDTDEHAWAQQLAASTRAAFISALSAPAGLAGVA